MDTPNQHTPAAEPAKLRLHVWFFAFTAVYWVLGIIFRVGFNYSEYSDSSTQIGNPLANFIGIFTPIGPINIAHPFVLLFGLPIVTPLFLIFVEKYLRRKNFTTGKRIVSNLLALLVLTCLMDIFSAQGPIGSISIFFVSLQHYFGSGCEIINFVTINCVS